MITNEGCVLVHFAIYVTKGLILTHPVHQEKTHEAMCTYELQDG